MSQKIEKGQVLLESYKGFLSFCKQENSHNWVSVQNLLDILKQKNKFLSKDEFIDLVSKKKLRMGNPYGFGFVENINGRTIRWYKERKKPTLNTRSEYWDYVKKCLFGDPEGTIHGLMNINDLTNEDLKEIVNLICLDLDEKEFYKDSFFLRVRGVGVIDKDDVFCPDNKEKLANDLIECKGLFNKQAVNSMVEKNDQNTNNIDTDDVFCPDNKEKLANDLIECKGLFNKQAVNSMVEKNDQNTNNSKKRLIAGIILVLLGIIGCSTTLGLGLAGQFAFVLLLFFITTSVTGLGCLLWKKIINCLGPYYSDFSNEFSWNDCCKTGSETPSTETHIYKNKKNKEEK